MPTRGDHLSQTQSFDLRSSPANIVVNLTSSASQILNSVVSVIGRRASICCQWRTENRTRSYLPGYAFSPELADSLSQPSKELGMIDHAHVSRVPRA